MRDLEDLKARIVSMLVLVAAVSFVDAVVDPGSHPASWILSVGAAVALFIIALTLFLRIGGHDRRESVDN
jgi:uncharacterized membrane protein YqhA